MIETSPRTNPLIVIAATAVILTCLLAIGVMTGVVPSPLAKERAATHELTGFANSASPAAPAVSTPSTARSYVATGETAAPQTVQRRAPSAPEAPAINNASGATATQPAHTAQPAPCKNCGRVTSLRVVKEQGEAGMLGPGAGALAGGLLGRQLGSGHGKTIATVLGAGAGAAAGTEIERRYKAKTRYVVAVRMESGQIRYFNYAAAPGVQSGDAVRVVNGRLVGD